MREERLRRILEIVNQEGKINVADICEQFDVSDMTARRDLRELDREGLIRRVHGGAVSRRGRSYEPPYQLRTAKHVEAKRAIGRRAAEMITDGESIALDVGTTTLEIARALEGKRNLTIITASLPIANEVVSNYSLDSDIRLILTGGIVRSGELSMIGNIAMETYNSFRVDKSFVGIGGVSLEDGLTEYNLEDAQVKKSLIESGHEVIVVADGSKFRTTTFATVAPLDVVDAIVTDSNVPADIIQALRDRGVQTIITDEK